VFNGLVKHWNNYTAAFFNKPILFNINNKYLNIIFICKNKTAILRRGKRMPLYLGIIALTQQRNFRFTTTGYKSGRD
jgi:hypothetical protein